MLTAALPPTERTLIHLNGKLTLPEAMNRRVHVAQSLQLPINRVRVEAHPSKRADLCVLAVTRKDPFGISIPWDGPYHPGACISKPVVCGVYEDATIGTFTIPGKHFLVMGVTNSGKSKLWQSIYGEVLSRSNVSVIYLDPAKGMQTVGPLIDGLAFVGTQERIVVAALKSLEALITHRTNILASEGFDDWDPRSSIEYLIIHVEEIGGLAGRTFVKVAERARSAGISLVLSLQRASSDRMNTSVRYNLGTSMCFGTKDLVDSKFALSDRTLAAGAAPHDWGSRFKGQYYLEDDSIDPYRFAIPLKSLWLGEGYRPRLEAAVRYGSKWRCQPSPSTRDYVASLSGLSIVKRIEAEDSTVSTSENPNGLPDRSVDSSISSTISARDKVDEYLRLAGIGGQFSFSQAKEALIPVTGRGAAWLNVELKRRCSADSTPRVERLGSGIYRVISC